MNLLTACPTYYVTIPSQTKTYSLIQAGYKSALHPSNTYVMFGLQYILKEYLKDFTEADITAAEQFWAMQGVAFDSQPWRELFTAYNGKLPVEIKAIPEGTILNTADHVIFCTVQNTDRNFSWLVPYLGFVFQDLGALIASASSSQIMRSYLVNILMHYMKEEKLADRVMYDYPNSFEQAAHLLLFNVTDGVLGREFLKDYYHLEALPNSTIRYYTKQEMLFNARTEFEFLKNLLSVPLTSDIRIEIQDTDRLQDILKLFKNKQEELAKSEYAIILSVRSRDDSYNTIKSFIQTLLDTIYVCLGFQEVVLNDGSKFIVPNSGVIIHIQNSLAATELYTLYDSYIRRCQMDINGERRYLQPGCIIVTHESDPTSHNLGIQNFKYAMLYYEELSSKVAVNSPSSKPVGFDLHGRHISGYDMGAKNILIPTYRNGEILQEYTFDGIRGSMRKPLYYEGNIEAVAPDMELPFDENAQAWGGAWEEDIPADELFIVNP